MKRSSYKTCFVVPLLAAILGCQSSMYSKVVNGTYVETKALDSQSIQKISVPQNWKISRSSDKEIQIKVVKQLNYFGFPEEPVSIDDVAPEMGVLSNLNGNKLSLRDFGGFSTEDGGTQISVELIVPNSMKIETTRYPPMTIYQMRKNDFNTNGIQWKKVKTTLLRKKYE